mgnify:CR=1 FL=1
MVGGVKKGKAESRKLEKSEAGGVRSEANRADARF